MVTLRVRRAVGFLQVNTKKDPRNRVGRPRSADRSGLTAAQILRVDALARREAMRIRALLARVLHADEVNAVWSHHETSVRSRLATVPAEWAPTLHGCAANGAEHVEHALVELVHQLLTELAAVDEGPCLVLDYEADPALDAPGPLSQSRTLTAARARLARLQAQKMSIQERIA